MIELLQGLPPQAAILVSALIALAGTFLLILNQRHVTRRHATVDMLMRNLWDKDFLGTHREFVGITRDKPRMQKICANLPAAIRDRANGTLSTDGRAVIDDAITLQRMLNHYELIAIGIRDGSYNERIYRRWYHQNYVQEIERCQQFISIVRELAALPQSGKLFSEAEETARRWALLGPIRASERHFRLFGRTIIVQHSK